MLSLGIRQCLTGVPFNSARFVTAPIQRVNVVRIVVVVRVTGTCTLHCSFFLVGDTFIELAHVENTGSHTHETST